MATSLWNGIGDGRKIEKRRRIRCIRRRRRGRICTIGNLFLKHNENIEFGPPSSHSPSLAYSIINFTTGITITIIPITIKCFAIEINPTALHRNTRHHIMFVASVIYTITVLLRVEMKRRQSRST